MGVKVTSARRRLDGQVSEAAFQAAVIQLAQLRGWRVQHNFDSRRSGPDAGYPDLTLARMEPRGRLGARLVVAELKTMRGRVSRAQAEWLAHFAAAGVEAHIWRPSQWSEIEEVLR